MAQPISQDSAEWQVYAEAQRAKAEALQAENARLWAQNNQMNQTFRDPYAYQSWYNTTRLNDPLLPLWPFLNAISPSPLYHTPLAVPVYSRPHSPWRGRARSRSPRRYHK